MKKTEPRDLFFVLKLFKKEGITNFDKRIPVVMLHLIYSK